MPDAGTFQDQLASACPLKPRCKEQMLPSIDSKRWSSRGSPAAPNFAMRCNAVRRFTSSHSASLASLSSRMSLMHVSAVISLFMGMWGQKPTRRLLVPEVSGTRLDVQPHVAHQWRTFCASGLTGAKVSAPPSRRDPMRPPFHSLTTTPRRATTGQPRKNESSCLARQPHKVTTMLKAVLSAMVISRLKNSRPSLLETACTWRKPTTTPQRSTTTSASALSAGGPAMVVAADEARRTSQGNANKSRKATLRCQPLPRTPWRSTLRQIGRAHV